MPPVEACGSGRVGRSGDDDSDEDESRSMVMRRTGSSGAEGRGRGRSKRKVEGKDVGGEAVLVVGGEAKAALAVETAIQALALARPP